MERVEITQCMVGICHMQVCAVDDATDEEILEVCNSQNPSGTSGGWQEVVREELEFNIKEMLPRPCSDYPGRTHFLVAC